LKRERVQGDLERQVLTAVIVNDAVLSQVRSRVKDDEPFRSRWSNIVYGWCADYDKKYGRAPRKAVLSLFRNFEHSTRDKETVELVGSFLEGLDRDYRQAAREINQDYLIDQAMKHFSEVRLERLKDSIESELARGKVERAVDRVSKFIPLSQGAESFVEVLTDVSALWRAVEASDEDVLVHYGGALGQFFGRQLSRDSLVAFMAPEKRGKTFWLMDLAWRSAVKCKRRTVFYSVGDMSEKQVLRRFITRAAQRPLRAGKFKRPVSVRNSEDEVIEIKRRVEVFKKDITAKEIRKAAKLIRMTTAHSSTSLLKLKCLPNSTCRVADVRSDFEELSRSGWVPDVAVIDYADILAAESNERDFRHRIDQTWRALRKLSQEFHCLVVTATQSNATSYEAKVIGRRHFSEDKRKLAHVTAMYGLNQNEEEKQQDAYRLNSIVLRDAAYAESRCVTTVGSLEICHPAIVSSWQRDNT